MCSDLMWLWFLALHYRLIPVSEQIHTLPDNKWNTTNSHRKLFIQYVGKYFYILSKRMLKEKLGTKTYWIIETLKEKLKGGSTDPPVREWDYPKRSCIILLEGAKDLEFWVMCTILFYYSKFYLCSKYIFIIVI